jgi:hypothetical protein
MLKTVESELAKIICPDIDMDIANWWNKIDYSDINLRQQFMTYMDVIKFLKSIKLL